MFTGACMSQLFAVDKHSNRGTELIWKSWITSPPKSIHILILHLKNNWILFPHDAYASHTCTSLFLRWVLWQYLFLVGTSSMEKSPSWEANTCLSGKKFPALCGSQTFITMVTSFYTTGARWTVHILIFFNFTGDFNIILPSTLRYPIQCLPNLRFCDWRLVCIYHLSIHATCLMNMFLDLVTPIIFADNNKLWSSC
jgi:hypothetical protein